MQLSIMMMVMVSIVLPTCWRCWIPGAGARDTYNTAMDIKDKILSSKEPAEQGPAIYPGGIERDNEIYVQTVDRICHYIFCYSDVFIDWYNNGAEWEHLKSEASRGHPLNYYFLVGFAIIYPLILIGLLLKE